MKEFNTAGPCNSAEHYLKKGTVDGKTVTIVGA
jgi:hypothetical protein